MLNNQEGKSETPERSVRAGFGRKVPEIDGAWKQYSGSEKFRIFPVSFDQILVLSSGKQPEVVGKIQRFFDLEYYFRFPSISGGFLPETVIFLDLSDRFRSFWETGILDLGCTSLVLRLYSTRTPEYWSLAFSPLTAPKS